MDDEWVLLCSVTVLPCSVTEELELLLLKEMLEEDEIPSVIVNKRDSIYLYGDMELRVRSLDLLRAKQIMTNKNEA